MNEKQLGPKLDDILCCKAVDTNVKITTCNLMSSLLGHNRSFVINEDTLKFLGETTKNEELKSLTQEVLQEKNDNSILAKED